MPLSPQVGKGPLKKRIIGFVVAQWVVRLSPLEWLLGTLMVDTSLCPTALGLAVGLPVLPTGLTGITREGLSQSLGCAVLKNSHKSLSFCKATAYCSETKENTWIRYQDLWLASYGSPVTL